jgi:hemolysin III
MYKGERFNSITHLVGAAISLVGVSVLMTLAAISHDPWKITSCAIYGASMFFLFFFSTMYHSLKGKSKLFFKKLDHIGIYFLIIGTYAPFTLVTLPENGHRLFLLIIVLGIIGIAQEFLRKNISYNRKFSLTVYLLMGWSILLEFKNLWKAVDATTLTFLILGGVFYTAGVIFYVNDDKWKHAHGIWHLFVLLASIFQYVSVVIALFG